MSLSICHPELFGVTESSLTLAFSVEDGTGPVDALARILLNGETRVESGGPAGTRLLRIEDLEPGTEYRIDIRADGAEPLAPDTYWPGIVETHPPPNAACTARFATLNDLHFGEARFGGTLLGEGRYGDAAPGFPLVRESDGDLPYWRLMNEDAVAEINSLDVDAVFIKGDIADRGLPEQFEVAASCFAALEPPHHAFLGNHDHYALQEGIEVDGLGTLGQEPLPRSVDLGGWRLILVDTVDHGDTPGTFPEERLAWLAQALDETRETQTPTLVLGHHQPVPPEFSSGFPNNIGIDPDQSLRLYELVGRNPQVKAVLVGHTHRNRVRTHALSGDTPFIEVSCVKDYPGVCAHYRLYEDGQLRQEVRRISTERALAHSSFCRDFFNGGYRHFALGQLHERSLIIGGT